MRILIVDDHEVLRMGLRALLEQQEGWTVVDEAATATDAVEKALLHKPDIVLMDVRLPGRSGIEACREIVSLLPETQVIMLTSYTEQEPLFEAIEAGACGYILKQLDSGELIHALKMVRTGQAMLHPALVKKLFERVRDAARQERGTAFDKLTTQELRVLALIADGKKNREIAETLHIGMGTVRNYLTAIFEKLHFTNRTEAATYAAENNLKKYLQT
jgi:DNA-binding NarL/FixJ family response regulator